MFRVGSTRLYRWIFLSRARSSGAMKGSTSSARRSLKLKSNGPNVKNVITAAGYSSLTAVSL
jgi:hypothetical protein